MRGQKINSKNRKWIIYLREKASNPGIKRTGASPARKKRKESKTEKGDQ